MEFDRCLSDKLLPRCPFCGPSSRDIGVSGCQSCPWQAPERQRSALPRCRYHRPRSWTRAERPRRPSIRLPVVSWQAPERQRSALSGCRCPWPRHWKRAQRPHRPSNLSGCQSCPGKHRSVSAAPRRVAGATGRAARRERPPLSSTRSTLSTISLVPRHLFAATASGHRSILGV